METPGKFDVLNRINELCETVNINHNELSKRSGVPTSTISTWFNRGYLAGIPSLEKICSVFGISLLDFFNAENDRFVTDQKDIELLKQYHSLSDSQREVIDSSIRAFLRKD